MFDLKLYLLNDGNSKYKEAINLTEIQSKQDPETEPFKSLYAARLIWNSMKNDLENAIIDDDENYDIQIVLAAVELKLGMNYIDSEERVTGEEMLKKCLDRIKVKKKEKKCSGLVQQALNHLGILYSNRSNLDKSLKVLSLSMKLYKDYCLEVGCAPYTIDDIFNELSEIETDEAVKRRNEAFEDAYTHTLFFLAQVYSKIGASDQSALYCKETLTRQLKSRKFEPLEWSMNAATLAQYYSINNQFGEARRCIAAAELILSETGPKPACLTVDVSHCDGQFEVDALEKLSKGWADLCRLWLKYYLSLLEFSRDRLLKLSDSFDNQAVSSTEGLNSTESTYSDNNSNGNDSNVSKLNMQLNHHRSNHNDENNADDEDSKFLTSFFGELELTCIEARVRREPVRTFDEAREVFKEAQIMIKLAQEFYVMDGHCSDYISIAQDHSCLYKLITFFEPDLQRQCQMHKRRIDLLTVLLKQLNQQYYLLICRQLMFELGEIYSTMLDNKISIAEANNAGPNDPCWQKINHLARETINQFETYISTLKSNNGKLPEKFSEDDMRPALIAHFYCGRIYSKFIEYEPKKLYDNVTKSLEYYSYLVEYCRVNADAVDAVKSERDACKEMCQLLPARLEQIRTKIII